MAADEEERQVRGRGGQLVLEVEAGQAGHLQVGHHAGGLLLSRAHVGRRASAEGKLSTSRPAGAEQAGQGPPHGRLVVHEEDAATLRDDLADARHG